MKLFISWSGERSHRVAQLLKDWIPTVIAGLDTWLSSSEIDSGAQWFNAITQTLNDTSQGVFCLTRENLNKPWILFEAGALAKGSTDARVRTFLIDLETREVHDPLNQFNHVVPTKESILQLVKSINKSVLETPVSEMYLGPMFDVKWPEFESRFNQIIEETENASVSVPPRDLNIVVDDILEIVRGIDKQVAQQSSSSFSFASDRQGEKTIAPWVINEIFKTFKNIAGFKLDAEQKLAIYNHLVKAFPADQNLTPDFVFTVSSALFELKNHLFMNPGLLNDFFSGPITTILPLSPASKEFIKNKVDSWVAGNIDIAGVNHFIYRTMVTSPDSPFYSIRHSDRDRTNLYQAIFEYITTLGLPEKYMGTVA